MTIFTYKFTSKHVAKIGRVPRGDLQGQHSKKYNGLPCICTGSSNKEVLTEYVTL